MNTTSGTTDQITDAPKKDGGTDRRKRCKRGIMKFYIKSTLPNGLK
jgi:hypothetical protein